MTVTEHPVENGANISDHAYLRPREIELEIGWDGTGGAPDENYAQLKQLQARRLPFTIYTDRDILPNMLAVGIATVTEQRTAYSFMAILRCRQINLVSTQSTVVSPQQGAQANPAATATSKEQGTQTLQPGSAANTNAHSWLSMDLPASATPSATTP